MAPKASRKHKVSPARPKVVAPDDVRDYVAGGEKPLDVDVAAHLRWLETGEGQPWPRGRRS